MLFPLGKLMLSTFLLENNSKGNVDIKVFVDDPFPNDPIKANL